MTLEQARIDLDVLREVLAGAQRMADYHSQSDEKLRQNAALVAAGLAPLHSEWALTRDVEQAAKFRCEVECLRAVIALLGGTQAEAA